ncbi:unnamed protein product [marine sediment metagenome]|uniref:Tryptophan synthase beta chain-like PALP domain-containing protein n=1 Tax=marine sediment metagenome TaxID=412755 RepID=X1VDW2_9ZZZZ
MLHLTPEEKEKGIIAASSGNHGIATLIKNINPLTEVIGVQPVASPVWYEFLKAGKLIEMKVKETICGGLSGNVEKGSITFPIIQKYVRKSFW